MKCWAIHSLHYFCDPKNKEKESGYTQKSMVECKNYLLFAKY